MKTLFDRRLPAAVPAAVLAAACVTWLGLAALPAGAASSAASSASDSASTSVGSSSDSVKKSSDSSSKTVNLAEGDYRVIDVATLPERPGMARVRLHLADADDQEALDLYLPQQAVDSGRLSAGQTVKARQRAYGIELANGEPLRAFFLVLADDWYRELQTNPVIL